MEKLFRVSRTEHRQYQADVWADSEDEAIAKVKGYTNNEWPETVYVMEDHGSFSAQELKHEKEPDR